jgi:hypothetical protein
MSIAVTSLVPSTAAGFVCSGLFTPRSAAIAIASVGPTRRISWAKSVL